MTCEKPSVALGGRTLTLIIVEGESIGCGHGLNRALPKTCRKLNQKLVPTTTGRWRARLDRELVA